MIYIGYIHAVAGEPRRGRHGQREEEIERRREREKKKKRGESLEKKIHTKRSLVLGDLSDSFEDLSGNINVLSEVDHPCVYNDLSEVVSTFEATILVRLFHA